MTTYIDLIQDLNALEDVMIRLGKAFREPIAEGENDRALWAISKALFDMLLHIAKKGATQSDKADMRCIARAFADILRFLIEKEENDVLQSKEVAGAVCGNITAE